MFMLELFQLIENTCMCIKNMGVAQCWKKFNRNYVFLLKTFSS